MTNEERRIIYDQWVLSTAKTKELLNLSRHAESAGHLLYEKMKDIDKEQAFYYADADWKMADKLSDQADLQELESKRLYKILEENPFLCLDKFESCAMVGHSVRKKLEITFMDGVKAIGWIYPWEGDYSGPPYYFLQEGDSRTSVYIDHGCTVFDVKLI